MRNHGKRYQWEPYRGKFPDPTAHEYDFICDFLCTFPAEKDEFVEDEDYWSYQNEYGIPNLRQLFLEHLHQIRESKGYDVESQFLSPFEPNVAASLDEYHRVGSDGGCDGGDQLDQRLDDKEELGVCKRGQVCFLPFEPYSEGAILVCICSLGFSRSSNVGMSLVWDSQYKFLNTLSGSFTTLLPLSAFTGSNSHQSQEIQVSKPF